VKPGFEANSCVLYDAAKQQWLYLHSPSSILSTGWVDSVAQLLKQVESLVKSERYYAVGFLAYGAAPAFDQAPGKIKSYLAAGDSYQVNYTYRPAIAEYS